ncbi:MAG TPA: GntR family transcriptional regulator [Chloroflexota bacterium]|nr:GntR family transcriptional regulator [Chloroflexota bacterium]
MTPTTAAPAGAAPASGPRLPSRLGGQRRTTHALAVDELRRMILSGRLSPGDRLRIEDLAAALGVSPMPVREALHHLTADGSVTLDPYRGFSVADLSAAEAEDLYSTRAVLEALAARVAVPRLDESTLAALSEALAHQAAACAAGDATAFIEWDLGFHRTLYATAGRPVLARQIAGLINSSVRYSRANLPLPGSMDAALEAHRTIMDACQRRDADLAAAVTRRHTEQAAASVIRVLLARDGRPGRSEHAGAAGAAGGGRTAAPGRGEPAPGERGSTWDCA